MKNNHKKGFTLVELLIAISIMAVLSTLGFSLFKSSLARARDSKRMSDLKQIQTALELYHNTNGTYPHTTDWVYSGAGGIWIPGLDAKYIPRMPVDPKNGTSCAPWNSNTCFNYAYYSADSFCHLGGTNDGYILTARLEAHSGTDLSQQPYYNSDGSLCAKWLSDDQVTGTDEVADGLYVVRNP